MSNLELYILLEYTPFKEPFLSDYEVLLYFLGRLNELLLISLLIVLSFLQHSEILPQSARFQVPRYQIHFIVLVMQQILSHQA